jgi:hypothetical protein
MMMMRMMKVMAILLVRKIGFGCNNSLMPCFLIRELFKGCSSVLDCLLEHD